MGAYHFRNEKDDIKKQKIARRRELMRMEEIYLQEQEEENRKAAVQDDKTIQAKADLQIGDPNDKHEHEADQVAKKVTSGNESNVLQKMKEGGTVSIHRSHEEEGKGTLMAKNEDGALHGTDQLQTKLDGSKGSGQSLDENTRSEMEHKMGADLGDVKIHTDSNAHQMAEGINAKAFTHGQDIYFKQGNFNTSSVEGKELLAHELTHTQQQKEGVGRMVQRQAQNPSNPPPDPTDFSFQLIAADNYPKGDPDKAALLQAIEELYNVDESTALDTLSEWHWTQSFDGVNATQVYSVKLNNATFISGLSNMFNSSVTIEEKAPVEAGSQATVNTGGEEDESVNEIEIKKEYGVNPYLKSALRHFKTAKTTAFTTVEAAAITAFVKAAASLTIVETDFFVKWLSKKYPAGNWGAEPFSQIELSTIDDFTQKLKEFSADKLNQLKATGLMEEYYRTEDKKLEEKFTDTAHTINNIDPTLIEEFTSISGLTWGDIGTIAAGTSIPGGSILTGVLNDVKKREQLSELEKKLQKTGHSLKEITNYISTYREQALKMAFYMLDENRKDVTDEYLRYKKPEEVAALIKFVKDNYGSKFAETDKDRASGIINYLRQFGGSQRTAALLLGFMDPLLPGIISKDNPRDLAVFLRDKSARKVMEALAWLEWTKTLDDVKIKLIVTGDLRQAEIDKFIPPSNPVLAQPYIDKIFDDYPQLASAWKQDQETELPMRQEGAKSYPILADISIDPRELFMSDQKNRQEFILSVLMDKLVCNQELRDKLVEDNEKVWELDGVMEMTKSKFSISNGTNEYKLIKDHIDDISFSDTWTSIGIAALGIVLGLAGIFTGGLTTIAGAALIAGSVGVSAYDLYRENKKYEFQKSAYDTALDDANELSSKAPDATGVIMALIGLGIDLTQFLKPLAKGVTVLVNATRALTQGEAVSELLSRISKIASKYKQLKALTAAEEIAEATSELEKEVGELYDFLGKSRIRGAGDKEAFIKDFISRIGKHEVTPEFEAFLAGFKVPKEIGEVGKPGLALLFKEDPDTLALLLRKFEGNPKLILQFSVESILNPSFAPSLSRIRKLPNLTEEIVAEIYTGLYKGVRQGFGELPKVLDALEVARFADPKLVKEVLTDQKLRKLLPTYPNPKDMEAQWQAFNSALGTTAVNTSRRTQKVSEFSKFVVDAEKKRLAAIQKIGEALPRNAYEYAGRTFYFDLEKNQVKVQRLAEKYGIKPPTISALEEASNANSELMKEMNQLRDLAQKYPNGFKFDAKGFPDFSDIVYKKKTIIDGKEVEVTAEVDIRKLDPDKLEGSATDIRNANKEMRKRIPGWRAPENYTWHHIQNSTKLQLIPTDVHKLIGHTGGRGTAGLLGE